MRVVAMVLAAGFLALYGPAAAQDQSLAQQLQRMRRELNDLQSYVYSGRTPPREAVDSGAVAGSGGGDAIVNLQVGVQSLEAQMRNLTGRIEEIEHRLASVSNRLDRLSSDIDVRFRELEGGGPGAAGVSEGSPPARRSDTGGPSTATAASRPDGTPPISSIGESERGAAEAKGLAPGQQLFGTLSSTGGAQAATPSSRPSTGPVAADVPAEDGLKPDDAQIAALPSAQPKEQYDYAFSLLQKRELDKAAEAFRSFVDRNPSSPLASNAMYWLGETHYFRNDYTAAARVFLEGYQKYPKGSKAPDNLFKLGMSLAAVDEKTSACAAFNRLTTEFSKGHARLITDAKSEMDRIGCS